MTNLTKLYEETLNEWGKDHKMLRYLVDSARTILFDTKKQNIKSNVIIYALEQIEYYTINAIKDGTIKNSIDLLSYLEKITKEKLPDIKLVIDDDFDKYDIEETRMFK